jgi:hypothetical protein
MIICKADVAVVFKEKKKRTSIKGVFGPRKDMNKAASVVR